MRRLVALCSVLVAAPALAQDTGALERAASSFYAAYAALPHQGGIPDATARLRYAPLLSPRLNQLIGAAAAAQTRFQKANHNSPPLIEGDLFSSLFEGFTSFAVGPCSGDAKQGQCSVKLTYQDKSAKPVSWTDQVLLVNTPQGWKVDDIAYKAGFAFGNTGLLSDTLKMTVAQAP
jgi:hypothetical protein